MQFIMGYNPIITIRSCHGRIQHNYNQELDPRGGFLINPGVGYQRMFSSGFGMSFAFGYQFHRLSYNGENDYQLDIDYNRLTIKIGIIFN
jgi:hypothetical protein